MLSRVASIAPFLNKMSPSNRRGDLPVLSKTESGRVMCRYIDDAKTLAPGEDLVVELPDGRLLTYHLNVFPATDTEPEMKEWSVHLYTLRQKTEKCSQRFHERRAWFYPASQGAKPKDYSDEQPGWHYRVWS